MTSQMLITVAIAFALAGIGLLGHGLFHLAYYGSWFAHSVGNLLWYIGDEATRRWLWEPASWVGVADFLNWMPAWAACFLIAWICVGIEAGKEFDGKARRF